MPQDRKQRESGQSLMEFALVAPFLLLLAVGVIELGRVTFYTVEVNNAATAGAQYAGQNPLNAQNTVVISSTAQQDAGVPMMTVSSVNGCTCDDQTGISCRYPIPGQGACTASLSCPNNEQIVECVQVQTQANITPLFHFPLLPSNYQANGLAVIRVQRY